MQHWHWPELAPHKPRKEKSPYGPGGRLCAWEKATGVEDAALPGVFPRRHLWGLTLLGAICIGLAWGPVLGFWVTLAGALVLGRMLALDATTYTLPLVYTVPLLVVGWGHALAEGRLLGALGMAAVFWLAGKLLARSRWQNAVGGGDMWLLAAMFAFLSVQDALFAVALGCLAGLPMVWRNPRAMVPLGVPLIVGWVAWVRLAPVVHAYLIF